jgi:hypothetical protein
MVVARFAFDLVHGETLEPFPLDRLYNHHLVVYSVPRAPNEAEGEDNKETTPRVDPADPAAAAAAAAAETLHENNLSAVLAPCGVGAFFAGGGAEWRGLRNAEDERKRNHPANSDAGWFDGARAWIDAPNARWGVNVHVVDLRNVQSVRDSVQCNCAYYAKHMRGTPETFDRSPRLGGGIECCGDEAVGPTLANASANRTPEPVAFVYEIHWAPLKDVRAFFASRRNREAFPKTADVFSRGAPKTATLMVSSSPDLDGASCAGEYDARPCPWGFVPPGDHRDATADERKEREAKAWRARRDDRDRKRYPRDQTCADTDERTGEARKVTVATSHVFRLPPRAAYDVRSVVGHQHVGGVGVRLLNVTGILSRAPSADAKQVSGESAPVPYLEAPVICESLPTYGKSKGEVGNELGFIVKMSECVFESPIRLRHGESYVVQSVYGADAENYAPAAFGPPYEGVMGYVTLTFTIPPGYRVGVFSESGAREWTDVSDGDAATADADPSDGSGTCEAEVNESGIADANDAAPGVSSPETARPLVPSLSSAHSNGDETEKSAVLTSDGAYPEINVAWRFVSRDDDASREFVRVTMTLTDRLSHGENAAVLGPTWMALGIHRPGGSGMPGADMTIVQSREGGDSWTFAEHYTAAYDAPRKRSFYGEDVKTIVANGCSVAFHVTNATDRTNGTSGHAESVVFATQIVAFQRRCEISPGEGNETRGQETLANVTRGTATPIVFAFGEWGKPRMAYHARRAGERIVTW